MPQRTTHVKAYEYRDFYSECQSILIRYEVINTRFAKQVKKV